MEQTNNALAVRGGVLANTILREEALSRFFGCCGTRGGDSTGLLQKENQSALNFTTSVKMELEAPFYAVRLFRVNRSGLNALDGNKAVVGVTASGAMVAAAPLTASQQLSAPVIDNVAYPRMAPPGTVTGFHPVNWPGRDIASLSNVGATATLTTKGPHGLLDGQTITLRDAELAPFNVTGAAITVTAPNAFTYAMASTPAAATAITGAYTASACGLPKPTLNQTVALSEKTALKSVPRTDGGTRPLLLYRLHNDGTRFPFPYHLLTEATRTTSPALRDRVIQLGVYLADGVDAIGGTFMPALELMDVYPVVSYSVPVLSVWGVGDSTMQNDSLVADKISSWLHRACLSVSTPQKPVVFANFGASSQNSSTYWTQAKIALEAGVAPPSVLFLGCDSVNDGACTPATVQSAFALAMDAISTAKKYDIPVLVLVSRMPLDSMNAAQYALKVAQDAELATLAASYGIGFLKFAGLGDNAQPERWTVEKNHGKDGIHPNEACIENDLAKQAIGVLSAIFADSASVLQNQQVTFERAPAERDPDYNRPLGAWVPVAERVAANVVDMLPERAETVDNGQRRSVRQSRLRVARNAELEPGMRVILHGDGDRIAHIISGPALMEDQLHMEIIVESYAHGQ